MRKTSFLYGIIIFALGFVVAENYGKEIKQEAVSTKQKIEKFIADSSLMKRAEKISTLAKNSKNRFVSSVKEKTRSLKTRTKRNKLPKTFYAYGTDNFDPSLNARCTLMGYKKTSKQVKLNMHCQGNHELQKQVSMNIYKKVRGGEL